MFRLQSAIYRGQKSGSFRLEPGIPLVGFCHGPDGAEAHAGRTRPLTGEELPVLLPRLPVKAVVHGDGQDAVLQGTVQPDEFLASDHAPTGFHPVFQQIGEHDAQCAVIQIFVLCRNRQPGGKGDALLPAAGGIVGHHCIDGGVFAIIPDGGGDVPNQFGEIGGQIGVFVSGHGLDCRQMVAQVVAHLPGLLDGLHQEQAALFLLLHLHLQQAGFKNQPLTQGGLLFQTLQGLQQHIVDGKDADQQTNPAEEEKTAVHAALQIGESIGDVKGSKKAVGIFAIQFERGE